MNTTKLVVALGLLAAGVAGIQAAGEKPPPEPPLTAISQPPIQPANPDPRMPFFLVCAKECGDCARLCNLAAAHCETMIAEGKKEHLPTLRLSQDCAAICSTAATVVAKNGPLSDLIVTACADACKRCGDACAKFPADPILKQCADECRKCEEACRKMLKNIVKVEK